VEHWCSPDGRERDKERERERWGKGRGINTPFKDNQALHPDSPNMIFYW
jgi:hypothetical protein